MKTSPKKPVAKPKKKPTGDLREAMYETSKDELAGSIEALRAKAQAGRLEGRYKI